MIRKERRDENSSSRVPALLEEHGKKVREKLKDRGVVTSTPRTLFNSSMRQMQRTWLQPQFRCPKRSNFSMKSVFNKKMILAGVAVILSSIPSAFAKQLERRQIQDLKVIENADGKSIRVSGIDMESAWPIKKVVTKRRNSDISVTIYVAISPTTNGKGSFDTTIDVPPEVKRVLLGRKRVVIWERK